MSSYLRIKEKKPSAKCFKCRQSVVIKGIYIFRNGTQHIGAYCKNCRKFFYLPHSEVSKLMDINKIPIVKSNLVEESAEFLGGNLSFDNLRPFSQFDEEFNEQDSHLGSILGRN